MTTIELYGPYDSTISGNPNFTYFTQGSKTDTFVKARHTNFRCEYVRADSNKEVSLISANLVDLVGKFTAINGLVITFVGLTDIKLIESIKIKMDEAEFDFSPKIILMLEHIGRVKLINKFGSNLSIKLPLDQFDGLINLFPNLPIELEIKITNPHIIRVDFKAIKLDTEETRTRIMDYENFSRRIKYYRFDRPDSDHLVSSDYGIKDIYWKFNKELESVNLEIGDFNINYDFFQLTCTNYLMEDQEPINELFWCPLSLHGTTALAGGANTVDFKFKFKPNYMDGLDGLNVFDGLLDLFLVEPRILYFYIQEGKPRCKFVRSV